MENIATVIQYKTDHIPFTLVSKCLIKSNLGIGQCKCVKELNYANFKFPYNNGTAVNIAQLL